MPFPYPYTQQPSPINWPIIILIFSGILTIIVLITVFFIIPNYAKGWLDNRIRGGINNLSNNIATYDCSSDIYNCDDFTTQAEAQAAFDARGPGDIHQLDRDGNGEACEGLP